jgi:hypothetical protein
MQLGPQKDKDVVIARGAGHSQLRGHLGPGFRFPG